MPTPPVKPTAEEKQQAKKYLMAEIGNGFDAIDGILDGKPNKIIGKSEFDEAFKQIDAGKGDPKSDRIYAAAAIVFANNGVITRDEWANRRRQGVEGSIRKGLDSLLEGLDAISPSDVKNGKGNQNER